MKWLLLLFSLPAFAAFPVISGIAADAPSRSTVRIRFTTDVTATSTIEYGPTTSYGTTFTDSGSSTAHAIPIGGLAGGTTYHYRINATNGGNTTTSADQTFDTTAVTPILAANLPTEFSTTGPSSFTATAAVSTCSGLQTQINTYSALDGNNNYRIDVAAGLTCEGQWTLPLKTGANPTGTGVIVIQSDGVYSPAGSRIGLTDAVPTLIANRVAARLLSTTPPECYFLGDFWWDDDAGVFALSKCTSTSPSTYVPISAAGSGTVVPATCTDGDWFYKTDVADHNNRAFWCVGTNNYRQVLFIGDGTIGDFNYSAMVAAANAKGYRIQGIRIATLGFPAAYTAQLTQNSRTIGSVNRCLASTPTTSTNIIFDRVIFDGVQFPYRTVYGLCPLDGVNNAVINSYFNELNRPLTDSSYEGTANCIIWYDGPGPMLVQNNYFKNCHGMAAFQSDESTVNANPSDFVIRGNTMYEDPCHNALDPCATAGRYWERRNQIELKRGVRWLIEGNLFDGGWASVTRGSCLSLTPRQGTVGVANNVIQISDITVRKNWFKNCMEPASVAGSSDGYAANTLIGRRITIENNLFSDSSISSTGWYTGWPNGFTSRGYIHLIQLSPEDLIIRNNTYWVAYGSDRADIYLNLGPYAGSGLIIANNIYYPSVGGSGINGGGVGSGTATLNAYSTAGPGNPNWLVYGNYFFQQSGVNPANYPSTGITWYTDAASFLMQDPTALNYRPKVSSPAVRAGWSQDDYVSAHGDTYNLRALSITSSGATLAYTAPSTNTCVVEYGTSATAGTGTRITDAGGIRFRNTALTGLATNTLYYYRVYCAQMASSSFTTN